MLVILDLDGTIIDSEKAHYNSFVKGITKKGYKLNSSQKKGIKSKFGMKGERILKEALPNISKKELDEIFFEVKKISVNEELKNVILIKGAKEFLINNFKKHDLALATNSSKIFTEKCVDFLGLKKFFKKIITASNVLNAKPNPEMINKIIKELNYKKNDCVFIGDSIFDFLAAKKAKIKFIAVLSKSDYKKELKKVSEYYSDLSKVKI